MEEYHGTPERLDFMSEVLETAHKKGVYNIEQLFCNKEGALLSEDFEHTSYLVKSYFPGKECDLSNMRECCGAMEALAHLHMGLKGTKSDLNVVQLPFLREAVKHNKELQRVRKFLKDKSQKTEFELFLLRHYDFFFDMAKNVTGELKQEDLETWLSEIRENKWICHGDFEHHNILMDGHSCYMIIFERMVVDNPIRDIYLFIRKLLEKNQWNPRLYRELIDSYQRVRKLSESDMIQLKYRFCYPEKFWKIVNFYYNNSKAWMSYKNSEKLQKLLEQENCRQEFLREIFGKVTAE